MTVNTTTLKLSKLSLSPSTVTSGGTTTGTVTLTANAPTGGAAVEIYQGDADLGYVLVSAGQKTTTFTYAPASVSSTTTYTEKATYNGTSVTTNLTVKP